MGADTSAPAGPDHRRPIVEFCVGGPAVSARVKGPKGPTRLRAWREMIAAAARDALGGIGLVAGPVEVRISEFSEVQTIDRDNLAKPILDALEGVVYANDRQVRDLRVEWCNIEARYVVRRMSIVVASALSFGEEFVWVRVFAYVPKEMLSS